MSASPASRWLLPLLLAGLVVALGIFGLQQRSGAGLASLPMQDYVEYWAAGSLLAEGKNPYDAAAVQALEKAAGRDEDAILMWNPPWALPLVVPLSWVDARSGHLPWLATQFVALLVSAWLLAGVYDVRWEHRLLLIGLLLTYVPCAVTLLVGQISALMLLGAAGFLAFVRQRCDFLAGMAASLLGIKPHLALLFWVALLVWTLRTNRWGVIAGGVVTGLGLTAVAVALRPDILSEYWHTLRHTPPSFYRSPTWGTVLRILLNSDNFALQFVPVLPGLLWLAWYGWVHRHDWAWPRHLPAVLLGSMLTAIYGAWLSDQCILFVVVAYLASVALDSPRARQIFALACHAAINTLALVLVILGVEYLYFIWLPPALIVAHCLLVGKRTRPSPSDPGVGTLSPG